jgi:hypothetical protein
MNLRFTRIALRLRAIFSRGVHGTRRIAATGVQRAAGAGGLMIATAVAAGAGYLLWVHPPMESVARGDVAIRTNQLTGSVDEFREGSLLLLPGLHEVRTFSLRDQVYRPEGSSRADGPSPFQSVEGMSLGVEKPARRHRRPDRAARRARRDLQDLHPLHRAGNFLEQTRRDPAAHRS